MLTIKHCWLRIFVTTIAIWSVIVPVTGVRASTFNDNHEVEIDGDTAIAPVSYIGGTMRRVYAVGTIAYIAEGSGLAIIDMADPARPMVLSRTYLSGRVNDLVVDNGYAFVTVGTAGVYVVDVTNSSAPRKIGHYAADYAGQLSVAGGFVYFTHKTGFHIIDVTNPANISATGSYTVPVIDAGGAQSIAISGQQVYLTYTHYDPTVGESSLYGELYIVDVSKPTEPTLSGSFARPFPSQGGDVVVEGTTAYFADGRYQGVSVLDVSDPTDPQQIGLYDEYIYRIVIQDNVGYFLKSHRLDLIDVSDPSNLVKIASYNFDTNSYGLGLYVLGKAAYLTSTVIGIEVVDISNPSQPAALGSYRTVADAGDVFVSGSYAYVVGRWFDGLRVVDISQPNSPKDVGYLELDGDPYRIQVAGSLLYIADAEGHSFWIIDISDPTNPTVVKKIVMSWYVDDLMVVGTTVYLANTVDGLRIYDVSDPAEPTEVGAYADGSHIYGVYVMGDVAYLADIGGKLIIVDISNRSDPKKLSEVSLPLLTSQQTWSVTVKDGFAYVMASGYSSGGSIHVVDVANPANPVLLPKHETKYSVQDIAFSGNTAFLATGDKYVQGELKVLDVSNPAGITELVSIPEGGTGIFIDEQHIYLAGDSLRILRYGEQDSYLYLPSITR